MSPVASTFRKYFIAAFVFVGAMSSIYLFFLWPFGRVAIPPARPLLIAHAGGGIGEVRLSNSLEALEHSYKKGFRYFELDFSWTTNGDLVVIHDWETSFEMLFGSAVDLPGTAEEFTRQRMSGGMTPLALESLKDWLRLRYDAQIVTDIKSDNLLGLRTIAGALGDLSIRVIPQIYEPEEYQAVRQLGFNRIIYTTYKTWKNPFQILRFAASAELFAVTMPQDRIAMFSLGERLNSLGVAVYAHTVNDVAQVNPLMKMGVTGFYTDVMTFDEVKAETAGGSIDSKL